VWDALVRADFPLLYCCAEPVGGRHRTVTPAVATQGSQQIYSFVTAQFRQTDVVVSIGAMVAAPDSVIEQKSTTKGLR
jgi:hypothetical protein